MYRPPKNAIKALTATKKVIKTGELYTACYHHAPKQFVGITLHCSNQCSSFSE